MAFRQPDSRGVIAYSSIAQMSLIGLGIFVMNDIGATGATFQMVNHGLLSVLLFLLAGVVEVRTGEGLFRRLGGARPRPRRRSRRSSCTTGIAALAVPGSALFASEFLVLLGRVPRLVADRRRWPRSRSCWRRCTCCAGSRRILHDAPAEPAPGLVAACATCAGRRSTSCRSGRRRARAVGLPVRRHAPRLALAARHRLDRHREGRAVIAAAAAIETPSVQLGPILPALVLTIGALAAAARRQLRERERARHERRDRPPQLRRRGPRDLVPLEQRRRHGLQRPARRRPLLRARAGHRVRQRRGLDPARLGHAPPRRPHRGVLRAALLRRRGHVPARVRQRLRHAVRRARAVLDLAVRAVRPRRARRGLARERAQVPRDGLGRLGRAALRQRPGLHRHGLAALRRDRQGAQRGRAAHRASCCSASR